MFAFLSAPTETYSKSFTASNCHNLAGMWLNAGGPYHLDSFGCQPNPSHLLSRDCSHWSGPVLLPWLQAKPEAGHLSSTWSHQLLRHCCYGML
uniref:Uncharacterized protein n=1 Tax=Amphiprion ocellaris TaxID=80972 RepID=A0A3Q1ATI2_AMPOC